MTDSSQENDFEILGCRVKMRPEDSERDTARSVIRFVETEIAALKSARPQLSSTDVAVLVALKIATDKVKMESEFQSAILKLEGTLNKALAQLQEPT
jgi:cell division protein ZapA (FtsZ GTPase activity inhibitor)